MSERMTEDVLAILRRSATHGGAGLGPQSTEVLLCEVERARAREDALEARVKALEGREQQAAALLVDWWQEMEATGYAPTSVRDRLARKVRAWLAPLTRDQRARAERDAMSVYSGPLKEPTS